MRGQERPDEFPAIPDDSRLGGHVLVTIFRAGYAMVCRQDEWGDLST
jgi:hypothetical protein